MDNFLCVYGLDNFYASLFSEVIRQMEHRSRGEIFLARGFSRVRKLVFAFELRFSRKISVIMGGRDLPAVSRRCGGFYPNCSWYGLEIPVC